MNDFKGINFITKVAIAEFFSDRFINRSGTLRPTFLEADCICALRQISFEKREALFKDNQATIDLRKENSRFSCTEPVPFDYLAEVIEDLLKDLLDRQMNDIKNVVSLGNGLLSVPSKKTNEDKQKKGSKNG